jgi:hypothetical protein
MKKLQFVDGIELNLSGKVRKKQLGDKWYILGRGKLIPVKTEQEANEILYEIQKEDVLKETERLIKFSYRLQKKYDNY